MANKITPLKNTVLVGAALAAAVANQHLTPSQYANFKRDQYAKHQSNSINDANNKKRNTSYSKNK